MDNNNWRAAQGQVQMPGSQVVGGGGGGGGSSVESMAAAGAAEGGDWRSQLLPDSRQRIVNKIMETLKRHLPFSGQEGMHDLKKIAVRFEEKIYAAATTQQDYLRKISLKMLTMETKSQNPMANSLQPGAASNSKNPQDPASQGMPSQIQNQVKQMSMPVVGNQSQVRHQLLSQNIQNNIASTGVPNSASLSSALPSVGGISQGTMSSVPGQGPSMQNIQNMSNVTPNAVGNPMGQGVPSNIYTNSQRQIQGRPQQVGTPEQQQQSQNSQQYLYNQQLQHHLMKQKFQQGGIPQSMMQSQIQQQQQQQNMLQQNQLQPSQQGVMQPSLRQTSASSALQQNQQSPSLQQSTQSMLQQQSQSVLRQQQQQQAQQSSIMHQQQGVMPQHSMQQQQQPQPQPQQLSGQQTNNVNLQQSQPISQQNSILDAQQQHQQQQRIIAQQNNISNMQQQQTINQQNNISNLHQQQSSVQQNNLPNMHQQQLGSQANLSGFQQQQMVGIQHGNSTLQSNQQSVHMLQPKVAVQQQMQQNMGSMLPNQSQPTQQQLMSQMQSPPGQLQQQLALPQQANPLQREMQQRIQTSGPMLQQQTMTDQQRSQRVISDVPLNPSSQTGNASGGDWQEEIYQKIKSMNEMYFPELNEMYQRMAAKLQQHDSLPQQPKNEQLEKLRFYKVMLERLILFLRTNKNEIQPTHKEKFAGVEKQIVNLLSLNRPRKPVASLPQGAQLLPHSVKQSQQQPPQNSQIQANEGQMNSQMQPMNVQGSMVAPQQNNVTNAQQNSLSSVSSGSSSRQNMLDGLHTGSNIDPGQGNTPNQIQQVAMSSLQQNPASGPQQMNINSMTSQNGLTTLQSNVSIPLQANSNMLQPQQIKQEQPMFSTQQLKQYQQRQMQQQYMQRQQLLQQQQQQQQPGQQQSAQLPTQQMMQLNQISDSNDVKMRQQMVGKSGILQQHHSSGQRPSYSQQQMKPGTTFSVSSQQVFQPTSPQIGHHPSPQIDQQNLLSHAKAGPPLQSANSPFIVPSPSTSMAPSPMPGDSDKMNSGVSSVSNAGNVAQQNTTAAPIPNQSLAIGTPGISASPLLAEFTSPDGTHGAASTIISGTSNVVEQPLERLIKVVKSMSPKALSASVSDISSVVSMVDRIAGSAPGNGSRAAVGEDLVAMTKCRLQARNFFTQDGPSGTKKMRRYTSAMPSSIVSSTGSVNDSLKHLNGNESDGESTGASSIKRPHIEANHSLEEELREINERLIDTVVYISEDDVDPSAVAAAAEGGEGTIVKCSFSAVALSPNLKSQYGSAQVSPIPPLRLLIPNNYPICSPVLLDKFPVEVSKEYEDLSIKAKSRFSTSLRALAQPMSLGDIAKTWDNCARAVISEYAQQSGGGTFSSKYGTWENCSSAV